MSQSSSPAAQSSAARSPRAQPDTRRDDVVDDLHGQAIADPYRWLEDPDAADTREWVAAQNAWTEQHLAAMPERAWFGELLEPILRQPRAGLPRESGGRWLVTRNDGHQDQDVWYVADSLDELRDGGRVIIDPNTFSADGSDSVSSVQVSDDGRLLAHGRSEAGSDWTHFVVVDVATGEPLPGEPEVVGKFHAAEWLPDNASYLYLGYPDSAGADGTTTEALGNPQLRLHRLGTAQTDDEVVLELPDEPEVNFHATVSHDDRWVVVSLVKGTENRNRLWLLPLSTPPQDPGRPGPTGVALGEPVRLLDEPVAAFDFVRVTDTGVVVSTDLDAPRGRVVEVPFTSGDDDPSTVGMVVELVPESDDVIEFVVAAGDELVIGRLHDAAPLVTRYGLDGTELGVVDVPGGGVIAIDAEAGRPGWGIAMSTLTRRSAAHRVVGDTATAIDLATPSDWTPPEFTVERRRATSADGTAVPYWLVRPSDADPSTAHPTMLYGYGGFKIPLGLTYRAIWPAWLAAGGAIAIANLRGGGEFGTDWYDDGRREHKQHVFDDFIAVGEHLVGTGATRHRQLAIHGGSNGGLLVGATMTQRPDLAAVALPAVGVLDLLRFHLFTIGWAWKSDYGDPDVAEDFAVALRYSPLHNLTEGTEYPATLVLTGDHDDRVVPLHSHKFTATLQRVQAGSAPILTRIEVDTGHGMGKPISKVAAEAADMLAFAAHHLGMVLTD